MSDKHIAYIGRRPFHNDAQYGTGEWEKGQVKVVASITAAKMLRHHDAYCEAAPVVGAEVIAEPAPKDKEEIAANAVHELLDAVQTMDAEALRTFAERNYSIKLDGRKSVNSLRIDAQQLVHRFGAPE